MKSISASLLHIPNEVYLAPLPVRRCPYHPQTILNRYNTDGVCGVCRYELLNSGRKCLPRGVA